MIENTDSWKKWLLGSGGILLLIAIGVSLLPWQNTHIGKATIDSNVQEAHASFDRGDYPLAIQQYSNLLRSGTLSVDNEGFIKYRLARAIWRAGDPIEALRAYKEIISSSKYSNLQRAYVVDGMQEIASESPTLDIQKEIFSGEPYASFFDPKESVELAYRKLAEYAVSFYPIAPAQLRIATWYANAVADMKNGKSPSSPQEIRQAREKAISHMASANADIARIMNNPTFFASRVPLLYDGQAGIASTLYFAKEPLLEDSSLLFEKALAFTLPNGLYTEDYALQKDFISFRYASFLAKAYGKERVPQIKELLERIYMKDGALKPHVASFFQANYSLSNNVHEQIELVATLDPRFKEAIANIGWEFPS